MSRKSKIQFNPSESEKSRGVATECCCCVCTPIIMAVGTCCCLVIVIFIILAIIAGVNIHACNKLSEKVDINNVIPTNFTYDPNIFQNLAFNSLNSIMTKTGKIYVSQSNSTSDTNVTVSVRIAATKTNEASVKGEDVETIKRITVERSNTFKGAFAWVGYLSFPPRCILAQVDVILPQVIPATTSIVTDVNDIVIYSNSVPYTSSKVKLTTINGEIDVRNLTVESLNLNTNNGDINASVLGITSELFAATDNGKIQLNVTVDPSATNPKIETTNKNGYNVTTGNGKIMVYNASIETTKESKKKEGKVGEGNGNLVVNTKNGDIDVTF
ncbi:8019_t:CDS:2 [Funneliformis caledonium]|uniref:8019_t:CDS:1 n=1 Tax=Funneliformis caledonium TaxID=1117310 RepID=A0A9N8ZAR0_9GLOM|nr:8019_t:CDS:2 [Funneliformis caledonium]